MIVVRLMGGLGNQMFQYALGRTLSLRRGVELKLDVTDVGNDSKRSYGLGNFNVAASLAAPADLESWTGSGLRARVRRFVDSRRLFRRPGFVVEADDHGLDPYAVDASDDAYLWGYWQREEYFKEAEKVVRKDITPARSLSTGAAAMAERIASVNAVAVHVRRGDYVTEAHVARRLPLCPMAYYRDAAARIQRENRDLEFFVFSDDPGWVREHLGWLSPAVFVSGAGDWEDWEELTLMRSCRHHIVANSTFSWWGAWLGSVDPAQRVIAPAKWFHGATPENDTITPHGWIRI